MCVSFYIGVTAVRVNINVGCGMWDVKMNHFRPAAGPLEVALRVQSGGTI